MVVPLLCSIYDPVSNLSFTESLEMSLPVWQLTLNNGGSFPFLDHVHPVILKSARDSPGTARILEYCLNRIFVEIIIYICFKLSGV